MAKGQKAKAEVISKIIAALGDDYVGEFDKKYYCWANDDNGERIQVSIALTCPKIFKGNDTVTSLNFEEDDEKIVAVTENISISQEEQESLAVLMEKLGL